MMMALMKQPKHQAGLAHQVQQPTVLGQPPQEAQERGVDLAAQVDPAHQSQRAQQPVQAHQPVRRSQS